MNTKSRFVLGLSTLALLVAAGCAQSGNNGPSGSGGSNSSSGGNNGSSGGSKGSGGSSSSSGGNNGSGGSSSSSGGNTGSGGSSTSSGGNTGSGGSSTSSGGNTGSGGASSSSGGDTGSGGASSSSGGSTGTGGTVQKLCATKTTIMTPVFMNFENYNGTTDASAYSTAFGATSVNMGNAYAGLYDYPEATGTAAPTLAMGGGHPPSTWAAGETLAATMWGMGGGIWMGCADASAYKGISFYVRGSSGTGMFSFSLSMDSTTLPDSSNSAGGGICPGTSDTCKPAVKDGIPITSDWTQVSILWSDFTPGTSGTTSVPPNGNNITGLGWNVPLAFIADPSKAADAGVYIPVAATVTIDIDDITFIQ